MGNTPSLAIAKIRRDAAIIATEVFFLSLDVIWGGGGRYQKKSDYGDDVHDAMGVLSECENVQVYKGLR